MSLAREQLLPHTVEAVRTLARRANSETWTTSKAAPLYVALGGRIIAMSYGDWLVLDLTSKRLSVVNQQSKENLV